MTFRIEVFKGWKTTPYVRHLVDMRLKEFSNYPYLYVGNLEDELQYAKVYTIFPQAVLVVGFHGDEIVGLFSGMPLNSPVSFMEKWANQLKKKGLDVEKYFYAGELIVEPSFRKTGIGTLLTQKLIEAAQEVGYENMMLISAIRPPDHPMRPQNYFDSDTLWGRFGFEKSPVKLSIPWPTRQVDGSVKDEPNEVACWLREEAIQK